MKVLTRYPVYINRKKVSGADLYMNFDSNGKPTTKEEWKTFQKWYNAKGYTPTLTVDGVTGPKTNTAWTSKGAEFVNETRALIGAITNATMGGSPTTTTTTTTQEPTQQQKDEAAKKGLQWDKVKGWVAVAAQAGQQTGLWDAVLNKFGLAPSQPSTTITTTEGGGTAVIPGAGTVTVTTPEEEAKKKRRRNLLIVGGVAVVAIIAVVLLTRKKGDSVAPASTPAK